MKKAFTCILTLALVLGLVGCGRTMNDIIENEPSITGIVKEVSENFILIECEATDSNPWTEYSVSLNVENSDSMTHFTVGDEVVVYYDGNVAETTPLEIGTVYAITLKTPANRGQNAVVLNKCLDEVSGNMTFYEEPVKEAQSSGGTVTVRLYRDLNEEQADNLKDILDDVDEWVDDHSVDRLAYYFDGDFQLSDREHTYYFTYEYNVIYYDHYFAEISAEDMQYIKDLGAKCVELPDVEQTE